MKGMITQTHCDNCKQAFRDGDLYATINRTVRHIDCAQANSVIIELDNVTVQSIEAEMQALCAKYTLTDTEDEMERARR